MKEVAVQSPTDVGSVIGLVMLGVLLAVAGVALYHSFFTVQQQTTVSIERFGKFKRFAQTGLNYKVPLIDNVAKVLDLRVQQLVVKVETKTKDNVFVQLHVAVQYYVLHDKLMDAFYKLSRPEPQIVSHVQDVVRGQVPRMDLDHVFENKDEIAVAVKDGLTASMTEFGYGIQSTLVTEVDPDEKVKKAMNDINAAQRECVAANARGDAEKILVVKRAEADAESKKLQGQGIADQRTAIINGLQQSVEAFQKAVPGAGPEDVMQLVVLTNWMDAMKDIAASGKTNTVFLPSSPGSIGDIQSQIRNAMLTADAGSSSRAGSGASASPPSSSRGNGAKA